MATTIKIGHASMSEDGTRYGNAGDSTGTEIYILDNFDISKNLKPTVVLRPKSSTLAEKSAKACEDGCKNNAIGYSQQGRDTLYEEATKVNFDLAKITSKCNADCSSFMTVCAIAGGAGFKYYYGNSARSPVTSSMSAWFTQFGDYVALTSKHYLEKSDYLKRGDILVKEGTHTVMVLANGDKATGSNPDTAIVYSSIKLFINHIDIGETEVSAVLNVKKLEDNIEKSFNNFNSYSWRYEITCLDNSNKIDKNLVINNAKNSFTITGLNPQKSYSLRAVATKKQDNSEISSSNIIFSTLPIYPSSVRNLKVKIEGTEILNKSCNIAFEEPKKWGSSSYTKGYRLSLVLNGKEVVTSDSLISSTNTNINKTILLQSFSKSIIFNYGDCIQIGIQPWLKDSKNKLIFDKTAFKCSQPIYLKNKLNVVNKILVRIKDTYNHVILYKR